MAAINIKGLDVDALLTLRGEIDKRLSDKRRDLEKQLSRLASESQSSNGRAAGGVPRIAVRTDGRRTSAMRGRKVPPKYRSPDGETWAGRGAQPRWLAAALKEGQKLEEFLIEKPARKAAARKPRAKRQQ